MRIQGINCPAGHRYADHGYKRPDNGLIICRLCENNRRDARNEINRVKVNRTANAWYHANQEKVRIWRRLNKYGITEEEYNTLLEKQNYQCAVCHEIPEEWLCVDHDHITGKIRGLLCKSCNLLVGEYEKMDINAIRQYLVVRH